MDPLTHTLVGAVAGQAFFKRRLGAEVVPILALASNLPDIDALVMATGDPAAVMMRRSFGRAAAIRQTTATAGQTENSSCRHGSLRR